MTAMGRTLMRGVLTCVLLLGGVAADIFLHVPRGSNNRLNEVTANRKNANRLYDSQDNDKGGYNVGDKTDKPAGMNQANQYSMKYFQSGPYNTMNGGEGRSFMDIEWTNQHGCGNNVDTHCNIVLQYMCQDDVDGAGNIDTLRNGLTTDTQGYVRPGRNTVTNKNRKKTDVKMNRGLHESWDWSFRTKSFNVKPYNECIHPDGWSRYNNEEDCTSNGGQWLLLHSYLEKASDKTNKNACENTKTAGLVYKWAVPHDSTNGYQPECLVKSSAPDCIIAPWTRLVHSRDLACPQR
ncbi:protein DD3-3-like [Elysia marginata]|uniref:Protein DD3-3-like n=1 Tax=Elysia marginata TaxID=1093978 RepID=A0AAV4FDF4_9GAST|nr:protein DD3-3-like [Elysia marginata]